MNVQVNKPKQDKPFPKLMIVTTPDISDTGAIVLFTEERKGFVVYTPNDYRTIGYNSNSFLMECYSDFEGSITLSND